MKILRCMMQLLTKTFTVPRTAPSQTVKKRMRISSVGLDLITRFEGFVGYVYKDIGGHDTIGFGHVVLPGEHFITITREQALDLLAKDVEIAENAVNDFVTVPLNQDQFDAICSFVYNVGVNAFKKSTLLKLINDDEFYEASIEMLKWRHVGKEEVAGLLTRRQVESVLLYRI